MASLVDGGIGWDNNEGKGGKLFNKYSMVGGSYFFTTSITNSLPCHLIEQYSIMEGIRDLINSGSFSKECTMIPLSSL